MFHTIYCKQYDMFAVGERYNNLLISALGRKFSY